MNQDNASSVEEGNGDNNNNDDDDEAVEESRSFLARSHQSLTESRY
mgnify:CR=1 FL=1